MLHVEEWDPGFCCIDFDTAEVLHLPIHELQLRHRIKIMMVEWISIGTHLESNYRFRKY
jgi:hypothetical protein